MLILNDPSHAVGGPWALAVIIDDAPMVDANIARVVSAIFDAPGGLRRHLEVCARIERKGKV